MSNELQEKKRRGRPATVMPASLYASLLQCFGGEVSTRRGMLNKNYMIQGHGVLLRLKGRGVAGIDFLLDPKEKYVYRQGILRELGRILDDELAERIAITICECETLRHRTVRQYEAIMRYCRLQGLTVYLPSIIKETVSDIQDNKQTSASR